MAFSFSELSVWPEHHWYLWKGSYGSGSVNKVKKIRRKGSVLTAFKMFRHPDRIQILFDNAVLLCIIQFWIIQFGEIQDRWNEEPSWQKSMVKEESGTPFGEIVERDYGKPLKIISLFILDGVVIRRQTWTGCSFIFQLSCFLESLRSLLRYFICCGNLDR